MDDNKSPDPAGSTGVNGIPLPVFRVEGGKGEHGAMGESGGRPVSHRDSIVAAYIQNNKDGFTSGVPFPAS